MLYALLRNTRRWRRSINCHFSWPCVHFFLSNRKRANGIPFARVNNRIQKTPPSEWNPVLRHKHTQWRFLFYFIILFPHPDEKKKKNEERGRVRENSRKIKKTVCGVCAMDFSMRLSPTGTAPFLFFIFDDIVCEPRVLSAIRSGQTAKKITDTVKQWALVCPTHAGQWKRTFKGILLQGGI